MQVLFDLRPPYLVALQSQKVDMSRIVSILLFAVFIMISLFNIASTTMRYFSARQDLNTARGKQEETRNASAMVLAKIREAQALKTQLVAYLEFTRKEVPAVEFMKALEDAVPQGLKITTMTVRQDNVYMDGASLSENEIVALAANLDGMKYIVKKVDAPVTTRTVLGTRQIFDFRLTCDINGIIDIAANHPNRIPAEGGGGI